jgi:predicted O-methyltransferase YrrM
MTWLKHYRDNYYDLLNSRASGKKRGLIEGLYRRAEGFNLVFAHLESLNQSEYHIIETGTLRNPGNWKDGQSARLFTEFVEHHGGSVRSVDIDPEAVAAARNAITSDCFESTCQDSVLYLATQLDLDRVDLFYLDSYDVKWNDDHASADHHLMEFQIIEPHLRPGALVVIDDNSRFLSNNQRTGKGHYIADYLEAKGIKPLYDAYQIIYRF